MSPTWGCERRTYILRTMGLSVWLWTGCWVRAPAAIRQFQQSIGANPTGTVDDGLITQLLI